MNKKKLIEYIIQQRKIDRDAAIATAKSSLDAATNEESKPENEYDTRGLEASYLAGAIAKRVGEIEEVIYLLEQISPRDFEAGEKISVGALVELRVDGKETKNIFLISKGGGQPIHFEGKSIQLITTISPLGEALCGLKMGDTAEVEAGARIKEYQVIAIQ